MGSLPHLLLRVLCLSLIVLAGPMMAAEAEVPGRDASPVTSEADTAPAHRTASSRQRARPMSPNPRHAPHQGEGPSVSPREKDAETAQ